MLQDLIMTYNVKKQVSITNNINIFLLDLKENEGCINQKLIPYSQIKEIIQYKKKDDRDKRLLSRSFLFEFLNQQYGITDFELGFNEHKKPFLKIEPSINFSFSYAENYVLVGISKDKKLGVDIEFINSKFNLDEITYEIMCPSELEQFHSFVNKSSEQQNFFFQLFSAKESIVKAFGTGLFFDVKSICTVNNHHFTNDNVKFIYQPLGSWISQYSTAICVEQ